MINLLKNADKEAHFLPVCINCLRFGHKIFDCVSIFHKI